MIRKAATSAALALLATAANATDLSYNYAELRWVDTELESVDGDGSHLGDSYELSDQWPVVAHLSAIEERAVFIADWLVFLVFTVAFFAGLYCWTIVLESMRARTTTG